MLKKIKNTNVCSRVTDEVIILNVVPRRRQLGLIFLTTSLCIFTLRSEPNNKQVSNTMKPTKLRSDCTTFEISPFQLYQTRQFSTWNSDGPEQHELTAIDYPPRYISVFPSKPPLCTDVNPTYPLVTSWTHEPPSFQMLLSSVLPFGAASSNHTVHKTIQTFKITGD